jgi:hypothetical protein
VERSEEAMMDWSLRHQQSATIYRVTERLHDGRTAYVPASGIVATVSTWLAELDADSPLVEDLARAVCRADWPRAYAIGDRLAVDVTIAV